MACTLNLIFSELRLLRVNDTLLQQFRNVTLIFSVSMKKDKKFRNCLWDLEEMKGLT